MVHLAVHTLTKQHATRPSLHEAEKLNITDFMYASQGDLFHGFAWGLVSVFMGGAWIDKTGFKYCLTVFKNLNWNIYLKDIL